MAETTASFQCFFTNDEAATAISSVSTYSFVLEPNKKSSFLLEAPTDDFSFDKPAHLIVEATITASQRHQRIPFVLGGFEIVTNSRNLEVYVTDDEDKETYITTCRGIKHNNADDDLWYKALLVIPGGPRSMKRLRLKLLSLRPPTATESRFSFMKIKGRLPDVQHEAAATSATTTSPSHSHAHSHAQQYGSQPPAPAPSGLTTSDMSAAMAGVSMMVRSTEERLRHTLETSLTELTQVVGGRLQGVEQVVMQQSKGLLDLQNVIVRQHTVMTQQAELLTQLQQQQVILMETVQNLQSSILTMRTSAEASGAPHYCDNDTTNEEAAVVVKEEIEERSELSDGIPLNEQMAATANVATTAMENIPSQEVVFSIGEDDDDDKDKPYSRHRGAVNGDEKESYDAPSIAAEGETVVTSEQHGAVQDAAAADDDNTSLKQPGEMEDDKPPSRLRAKVTVKEGNVQEEEGKKAEDPCVPIFNDTIEDINTETTTSSKEPEEEVATTTPAVADTAPIIEEQEGASNDANDHDNDPSPDRSRSELEKSEEAIVLEPPDKGCVVDTTTSLSEDSTTAAAVEENGDEASSPTEIDLIDLTS